MLNNAFGLIHCVSNPFGNALLEINPNDLVSDELPYAFTDAEHRISMENQYYGGATGFFEILEPEELQYTYSITPSQFSPFFNSSSNADMGGHVKVIKYVLCGSN